MAERDLVAIIKAKQAEFAKLRAELEEAQSVLGARVRSPSPAPARGVSRRHPRRRNPRKRSVKMLEHSPVAREAAKVLGAAGRPLHVTAIAERLKRRGHPVTLGSLVSTLSRWVRSRSVFTRVRPNVFGLISPRRGSRGGRAR